MSEDWIEIRDAAMDTAAAIAFVSDPAVGGIAVFLGTSRSEQDSAGRQLIALDYEVYADMALPQMRDLAKRARDRWPIVRLVLLHRRGRVKLAEPSVVIAVACPHRAEAFDACRWLIDTLKAEVAIWKKEAWEEETLKDES